MTVLSVPRLPAFLVTLLAALALSAYLFGLAGLVVDSPLILMSAAGAAFVVAGALPATTEDETPPTLAWASVMIACLALLVAPTWPTLLPPGGASDLTHHLMLADVLARTRHLVDGTASEAALGEMAHYTPGVHLLMVIAASWGGVEPSRAAYPLLAFTIAVKAGFLFLITYDVLHRRAAGTALACAGVGLLLFAPPAYSLDGFLQAGFAAQVASELFVVAGWWAVARWWRHPRPAWMGLAGLLGAAVFVVWPIWIGPFMVAVALAVVLRRDVAWATRALCAAAAMLPVLLVAAVHLLQHAAWLRIAGTSGAVPPFAAGVLTWVLLSLSAVGAWTVRQRPEAVITRLFAGGLAAQALALWLLAEWRGAETPYMAMKMIYLAIYPIAVLGAAGLAAIVSRAGVYQRLAAAVLVPAVLAAGVFVLTTHPVPPPIVNIDLERAGRWAREHLPPECVAYMVDDAEQAYWLHLAVMGQPRAASGTADIDGYTSNRAIGRWLDGSSAAYAIARTGLLPGEVLREARILAQFGSAVVVGRDGGRCSAATPLS